MHDFLVVSETTVARLAWLALTKRMPGVIAVRALFPPVQPVLQRLAQALVRRRLAVDILRERPDLIACGNFDDFIRMNDSFATTEPWMDAHYHFDRADGSLGEYAYAYKHVVSNRVDRFPFLAHTLETILKRTGTAGIRVFGIPGDVLGVFRFRISEPPKSLKPRVEGRAIANAFAALAALFYSVFWVLGRTRLKDAKPKMHFLGSDFVGDPRQMTLLEEVGDAPDPVLVVLRNRGQRKTFASVLAGWPNCIATDGRVPLRQLPKMLAMLIRDTLRLFVHGRKISPEIFWDLIRLPFRRAMYRALFSRYAFRNFWARDEYNVEHIIRTQELRRIGGRHFGQLHGLPAYPPILAQRRYIALDTYYVFGEEWHRRFHRDRWPSDMRVKAVGSYGMSRDQLLQLQRPRPPNIVCFIKHSFQDDATFAALPAIARAFPERLVYVKAKQQKGGAFRAKLDRMFETGPANLVETNENSYELLFKAQYSLSDPSSLVVEAIQFGLVSFALITDARWYKLYFRDFPHLCLTSAEDAIERIRAIERGAWTYPRLSYEPLTDLSGRVIWDAIREDMGLRAKQPGPLPYLNFTAPGVERRVRAVAS